MKLVTYQDTNGTQRVGVLRDEAIVQLDVADMRSLFEMGDAGLELARSAAAIEYDFARGGRVVSVGVPPPTPSLSTRGRTPRHTWPSWWIAILVPVVGDPIAKLCDVSEVGVIRWRAAASP